MPEAQQTPLPTGLVTFLFTDIEGSTPLWDRDPEGMRAAVRMHNIILDETIAGHGGRVYKVIGDAYQAAFALPEAAASAAVEAQQRLFSADWGEIGPLRVRMGLHTGHAIAAENDYETTHTLNKVARVMSAGHGGQILITAVVSDLVKNNLPEGATLRDMGLHRLKGLSQLEQLIQLNVPGLPDDFPPLATIDARPNNLPAQLTPFVGREHEISRAEGLLAGNRLLTILGPGGAGKTRLALQLANDLLDNMADGVWFTELAPLYESAQVPRSLATAIGLREREGRPVQELLQNYLKQKRSLIILDNCEHLVEACADLASELLQSTSETRIVVTSRQRLGLSGEQLLTLSGLETDDEAEGHDPLDSPAARLFIQSARLSNPDFEPDDLELELIARICRLVRGMPLAIVLAAGWVDLLSLEEIAAEITGNLDFLESDRRDIPERQRSLRAVFDYSWQLLSPEECLALGRMSVFRGGFERRTAQEVAGASLRTLGTLVNKSLLQRDGETNRFFIHESIRQYAAEKLEESGEADAIRAVHGRFYLKKLASLEVGLKGRRQVESLEEISLAFENFRSAWQWAIAANEVELLDRALEALYLYTRFHTRFAEGSELMRLARAQWPAAGANPPAFAGRLLIYYPDEHEDATANRERALEIARQHGKKTEIAYAKNQLGRHLAHNDIDLERGMALMEESLALYRELGDDFATATVLDELAFGYSLSDQTKRVQLARESLELRQKIGDTVGELDALRNLSIAAWWLGEFEEAQAHVDSALAISERARDLVSYGWMLSLKAETLLFAGDFEKTRQMLDQITHIYNETDDGELRINVELIRAMYIFFVEDDPLKARKLAMEAYPPQEQLSMLWWNLTLFVMTDAVLGMFESAERFAVRCLRVMHRTGVKLSAWPYLAVPVALIMDNRGESEWAARCLGFVSSRSYFTGWVKAWSEYQRLEKELRIKMGDASYEEAKARGQSLDTASLLAKFESLPL